MYSFEELEVWKEARRLRQSISIMAKSFPIEERFRIVDQLLRSSRSVTANIAEGNGRYHYKENVRFCRQARGSLNEVLDHLICAHDERLITLEQLTSYQNHIIKCHKLLNGYIAYLKKSKNTDTP